MIKLIQILKEASISYTPEKVDEVVRLAERDLDSVGKSFNVALQKLLDINMQELAQSPTEMETLLNKLSTLHKEIEVKHDKYYNIVDSFEIGEYPKNVIKLDDICTEIDNKNLDIYYLKDALSNVLEAAKDLAKFI